MNVVSIDVEAADEFIGAADWYNDQRDGLGDEFLADAQAAARALPRRLVHRVLSAADDLTPGAPRHPALPEGRGGNHGRSAL
jgi:hypothetical protein